MGLTVPFPQVTVTPVAPILLPVNQSAGQAIPLGVTHARVEYSVLLHTDPATELIVGVDLSLDGGATWMLWGGARRVGGVGLNKDGTTATMASFDVDLVRMIGDPPASDPAFDPLNAARRIRAQVSSIGTVIAGPGNLILSP